ncbi:DotU family type IV/VI secretion system protein [Hyalangium rubrum]|uniref:DotU family type IV/VI secretion system protein n=1 Tax=Hyalangium rubrum TaxID=3103134 RepID=A0ABU5GX37_9BACT|nr:DotU family type IV/VI secretion system protein [Hyalangium sp. s54d21]MDY7225752.1 DotU family type IV/VI secretion system protein [Hyalangium sp. s54d21]
MDRVNEATKDCFDAVIQLRQAEASSIPPPEVLNHRLRGVIDEVLRRAAVLGFSHQDAQDIGYALVSLLDELVLSKPEHYRQFWMSNLLQLHYFNETAAGDSFFNRLSTVRKDPHRAEVLRVYYLCMLFGFQGRYRIRGGELELMTLVDAVQKDLERAQPFDFDMLAPHGERPSENLALAKRRLSLTSAALAAVVLALLFYGGLVLGLDRTTSTMVHDIELHLATITKEGP